MPYTLTNQNNLSELALGSGGSPYKSYYYDFGPRLGATYLLRATPGYETQLRAGAGVVYDAADDQGDGLIGLSSPGFSGVNTFCPASYCNYNGQYSFPLPAQYVYTPIQNPPRTPFHVYLLRRRTAFHESVRPTGQCRITAECRRKQCPCAQLHWILLS